MSKLGIVAALALVTTVGGVYATWNYAGKNSSEVNHTSTIKITDATSSTKHGTIHVHGDTLSLSIDDVGNYKPGWNPTINNDNGGKLWMDFVPNVGAPDTLKFSYKITIEGNTYKDDDGTDKPIFTGIDTGTVVGSTEKTIIIDGTPDGTGCAGAYLIQEYSLTEMQDLFTFNSDIVVGTLEEYGEFKKAVEGIKIIITVNDITNPTA